MPVHVKEALLRRHFPFPPESGARKSNFQFMLRAVETTREYDERSKKSKNKYAINYLVNVCLEARKGEGVIEAAIALYIEPLHDVTVERYFTAFVSFLFSAL